ncbi:hypothetical protein P7M37_24235, partial [Vibrio parahaemolyticus]|nr:hypothetical protein [Vibrio parahaemolyticus]
FGGDLPPPQAREFKYLAVLYTSESRMEREMNRRFGAASAIYWSIYVPTLTYGHELWVVTERMRSRTQATEISFLRRVAGLQRELGVEPLLICDERGQLKWFGHLIRMPPGRLPFRGVLGMFHWKKAPRHTQNTLEGLHISSGLGTP